MGPCIGIILYKALTKLHVFLAYCQGFERGGQLQVASAILLWGFGNEKNFQALRLGSFFLFPRSPVANTSGYCCLVVHIPYVVAMASATHKPTTQEAGPVRVRM